VPLLETGVGFFRKTMLTAGLLCWTTAGTWATYVVYTHLPRELDAVLAIDFDIHGAVACLGWLLIYALLFSFTAVMAQVARATRQQLNEISAALLCKPADFFEHVHRPCGDFLEVAGLHLSNCGVPLLLLTTCLITYGIYLYTRIQRVLFLGGHPSDWLYLANLTSSCLALLLAVMVGPYQLSSAMWDLQTALDAARSRDVTVHEQIDAVEIMIERQNYGQGFGIPVADGTFVLSHELLQQVFLRVFLIGATIKAFLDNELGYAKEVASQQQKVLPELLANITATLNRSWREEQ